MINIDFYTQLSDLLNKGKYEEVYDLVCNNHKYDEDNPKLLNILGNCSTLKKNYNEAINFYKRAIEKDKYEAVFHSNLANVYLKKAYLSEDIDEKNVNLLEAKKNLEKACECEAIPKFYIDLGIIEYELNNDIKAMNLIDKGCRFSKNSTNDIYGKTLWMEIFQCEDKIRLYLYKLYYSVLRLREDLEYTGTNNLYHYSNLQGTIKMLTSKTPEFRIANVGYLDDPSEGIMFNHLLKSNMNYYDKYSELLLFDPIRTNGHFIDRRAYILSFSANTNESFNMWKNYGDSGKGCTLLFNKNFFDEDITFELTKDEKKVLTTNNRNLLYSVQYTDCEHANHFTITKNFSFLCNVLDDIMMNCSSINNSDKRIIINILDRIRYFYKRSDCKNDNEVRIVKYASVNESSYDMNYLENTRSPKLYLSLQIPDYSIDEILIGKQVTNPESLALFLYASKKIKNASLSTIDIR